jgi:hypothetical protein
MARTMTKPASNVRQITTVLIYVSLFAVLATYVMPIVGVTLPAFGKKSFSVRDFAGAIPKGMPSQKEQRPEKLSPNFDFMDLVKEISPRNPNTKATVTVSPEFVLGAMVPVALVLVYILALVGLFLAPIRNASGLLLTSGLSVLFAGYVLAGTYYIGQMAQRAFSDSVSKLSDTPFAAITQKFVQQVSVQPDYGLYALLLLTVLAFVLSWYRNTQAAR